MSDTIIKFENFSFQYNAQQSPTLKNINLSIKKGEKILIAGPSGCGKSTLIHCINGLIPFSYKGELSGSLTLYGKETKDLSLFDISAHVGTVLQDSDAQFVGLTVAEDLAFALENDCVETKELHRRVLQVAKMVNIDSHLKSAPDRLSGGQKQRVSMGGVMVDDVDLLLFDEPLANLDPATGKQAVELIDDLQKQTGAAVVIIEHRLEDVLHRAVDRVVLMNQGSIIFDGKSDELLCSDILKDNGIREPLYITALKYAGIKIKPDMCPAHILTIKLSEENKEKLNEWFLAQEKTNRKLDTKSILRADNISFAYPNGFKAISNISVNIKKGEMLAIVGTNGAGKTTFSKLICGFLDNSEGKLYLNDEDISDLSIKERADHIGYVMQNPNQMISKVMIMDELALGLRCRDVSEEEISRRCEKALKTCGLWKFRNWPISALSYGQKKRVTIAAILALDPEMIILDEPTAGQDYRHYTEIMEFLKELNKQGITVLMITHDMHLMLEYANRAVVFSKGQIIADDSSAKILTSKDIIKEASLKETSLYDLAIMCGISDASGFVQSFIDYERKMVRHE